ncbi:MAG: mandelate racemase/muconate lactonizing enzyme family protein, partial [Gammaproteobacteria bacterium]|nr:mandelate racemase/muconate lactonizing enzyme family protein [Gammaproteobacteria bacterium]
ITGYGEFGTGEFPRGLPGLVEDLAQSFVIGQDPGPVDKLALDMYRATRGASYGATQMAIAGLELAMWDIKGKALGVPVHTLFGGPFRKTQRVYYSHLGTYRARAAERMGVAPLRTMQDVADCAVEAVELGYTAFKTNLIFPGDPATVIAQGFRGPEHDQNATTALIRHAERQMGAMRDAVGPDIDILLDINFNFKPNEAIRLARALEPYDLYWLEIDNQAPAALAALRNAAPMPITSGEQLQTPRQYHPYFQAGAMDVAMIDVQYQGFGASKKTADLAETYEINIAPHNFNSHLATYQSLNLTAASSNVRIMESDVDSMPWRDEIITRIPEVVNGEMAVPSAPGWGADLDEDAARRNAWTA